MMLRLILFVIFCGYCGCIDEATDSWFNCSTNCIDKECNTTTGYCTKGCIGGYFSDKCDKSCPVTCKENNCTKANGYCIGGCVDGYLGRSCEYKCSERCLNGTCDKEDSHEHCVDFKCKPKWHGYFCEKSCEDCIDGVCDADSGCVNGCMPEKFSTFCDHDCSELNGYCFACEQNSGHCQICNTGYTGYRCDTKCDRCFNPYEYHSVPYNGSCPPGHYGLKCEKNCSQNCGIREGETTGRCYKFTGLCINDCQEGFYGSDCTKNCGYCNSTSEKSVCRNLDGGCLNGCKTGYYKYECTEKCPVNCKEHLCGQTTGNCTLGCTESHEGTFCDQKTKHSFPLSVTEMVVVVVGGLVAIVIIVFAIIVFLDRRKKRAGFEKIKGANVQ